LTAQSKHFIPKHIREYKEGKVIFRRMKLLDYVVWIKTIFTRLSYIDYVKWIKNKRERRK
jgi:hypothetical protein|tara:strand:+ start:84 stop:263 length:180 start_codon:yes stop_codon:yes gene_type:complete